MPRLSWPTMPLSTLRRGFYSGLDDNRVRRLRRSGMTFNKPRGRDTLSLAFESRIRVLPLNNISDLYAPVQPPTHDLRLRREASLPGCRSSDDNEESLAEASTEKTPQEAHDGAKMQRHPQREWRVLVVEPLAAWQVEHPVAYPSAHPVLYDDWPSLRRAAAGQPNSDGSSRGEMGSFTPAAMPKLHAGMDWRSLDAQWRNGSEADAAWVDRQLHFPISNRRHLRQNGDTTLFPRACTRHFAGADWKGVSISSTSSSSNGTLAVAAAPPLRAQVAHFFLAMIVDPLIDHDRFRREEAQVEMISGYRNLFYEAVELPTTSISSSAMDSSATAAVADVVRVPALSVYSCGPRFLRDIAKLNQQSLIKGFHRVSSEAKEQLILNSNFTVELFVPPLLLDDFVSAFAEEAWDVPQSTLNPGRTALYPGLAPPRTLLSYDGWVGKRPELIEAVKTEGKSLLRGSKYTLDGHEVQQQEVLTHIRVFGARDAEAVRLAGERETARAQFEGGDSAVARERNGGGVVVEPLRPGLQPDDECGDADAKRSGASATAAAVAGGTRE